MSSIILLVIVTAWAVVLVPMLLSRHEASSEVRSVDRFASAMRVLARRSAASKQARYVVTLRRPESPPSVMVNGTTPYASYIGSAAQRRVVADEPPAARPEAAEAGRLAEVRQRVVLRRRRVLLALITVALGLLALALAVSAAFWVGQLLGDILLAVYVVHLRRETARMAARRARAAARARRAQVQTVAAHGAASARAGGPPQLATPSNGMIIERQEDGSWHPVPVPLPSYVTAPMAPRQPAAARSSGSAGEREAPAGVGTEEDLDRRLDDMERRLAVND